MKFKELKGMKPEDLARKEQEAQMELLKLRGQSSTGTALKNPGQVRSLKKTLARINTITAVGGQPVVAKKNKQKEESVKNA